MAALSLNVGPAHLPVERVGTPGLGGGSGATVYPVAGADACFVVSA
jgi:hypothetical protein